MNQKYPQVQKDYILKCYLSGESVSSIEKNNDISHSTIKIWYRVIYFGLNSP